MPNAYDNSAAAAAFRQFLNSEDGRIQQEVLHSHILSALPESPKVILDAACGQGWLADKLSSQFPQVEAFDSSAALINQAKQNYPQLNFQVADATQTLPYQNHNFDVVILNMAAHDLSDLSAALTNLHRVLKPQGRFIMTIANPYYGFPVGVWKRGLWGRLLHKIPQLKLRPYHHLAKQKGQLHQWGGQLSSYFYPLSEYINQTLAKGFTLHSFRDIDSATDSHKYDARYRLHRWPMILLLAFEKSGK